MRIVVITALWKRAQLASIMFTNLMMRRSALRNSIQIEVLAVGSEGLTSRAIAETHGVNYIEHPNQPLGGKWNAVLTAARDLNPDAVMVLGSDNIVNEAIFEMWAKLLEDGYEYLGLLDSNIYRASTGMLIHWKGYHTDQRRGESIGSGRCYSRSLLDKVGWKLWEPWPSGLDWSVTLRLRKIRPKMKNIRMDEAGIHHLGIKTETTVCPFVMILRNSANRYQQIDESIIPEWFGPGIGSRILQFKG